MCHDCYKIVDIDRATDRGAKAATMFILTRLFGANHVEVEGHEFKCRFDAQASDGSKESRWISLFEENTPEQNMDLLKEARRQQCWYQTHRQSISGVDVPAPTPREEKPKLPAPAQANS